MRKLGVNAYRFSIEWAKVFPQSGKAEDVDPTAVEHYRKVVRLLLEAGIEPLITLHHFTSPRWWTEQGGWASPNTPEVFSAYARFVYREIAPQAKSFTTVNEPMVHLGGGYVLGVTPPGRKSFEELKAPLLGMLRAHAATYRALHENARTLGKSLAIGMAHHVRIFDPKRNWNPVDRLVARALDSAFNWTFPRALETGEVRMRIPGLVNLCEEVPGLAGTQDFFGLNYYTRDLVTLGFREGKLEPVTSTKPGNPTSDLGWELYPQGFARVLRKVAQEFPRLGILIAENGLADHDDSRRSRFLEEHLEVIREAVAEGVSLFGYCHWSLLDNYEWIEGFAPRFGLVEIDYSTYERRPRASFHRYSELIRKYGNFDRT